MSYIREKEILTVCLSRNIDFQGLYAGFGGMGNRNREDMPSITCGGELVLIRYEKSIV